MDEINYIVAGSLIDGSGADVHRNVYLAVEKGIITAIGSAEAMPRSDGAVVEDFSHCTIVPALVDCSVSLSRSPSVDSRVRISAEEASLEKKAAMLERHVRYCHAYGVLGVAERDDINDLLGRCYEGVEKGCILDIRTSSVDFLRINYSADVEDREAPNPQLNYENLCRIIQGKGEKKVVVVANGPQQVAEAIEAGCDAIEQGYGMGEANLRTMAEKNVLWIPSVLRAKNSLDSAGSGEEVGCRFSTRYVSPGKQDPGAEAYWKKVLAEQLGQLRLATKLGVAMAMGTGAGSVGILHGESMVEEMKLFIKAGCSLVESIRCASENGAEFFGMQKLGALNVGKNATFLLTRGTAQQLPRKLSYLEGIYIDGEPCTTYSKNPDRIA